MKSRNWVKLFFSTLAVGGITTGLIGFALKWNDYQSLFVHFEFIQILSVLVWLIGVGFIFSMISQAGFFAYLTVHRFGLSLFRSAWNGAQIVIILFVLFDIVFFRYQFYAKKSDTLFSFLTMAIIITLVSSIVAYLKMKRTNKGAFIPALFFMVVVTVVEWFPALRTDENSWVLLMLIPLLACNAYQLLFLPKFIEGNREKAAQV